MAGSNSAVAYSTPPTILPPDSSSVNDRSNLACPCDTAPGVLACRPGIDTRPRGVFCQASITWKSGACPMLRPGRTASTICSNGMSWFSWPARARSFTRASSSATVGEPERSTRRGRTLTKSPISPLVSLRPRFADGAPITTSGWPARRPSTAAHPASTVMNSVAPCLRPSALSPAVAFSSSTNGANAPR
ncbi:MAG: hypothetical protein AVDCRST_MAG68-4249 [uncultured Gemmatimonadetes bacterium]|uniref:Uncharacterized protein n=1 Tax=uncultured Gemmatimonadota bacterium TaxID=203437 RepID=A0A6J4MFY9_9BACT|nr:MAG: hypothetical protein AVDCRST_MAG68-4249 [uncultured Gemmatimonadota bacterium]